MAPGSISKALGLDFGGFWEDFGKILGGFGRFGGRFWKVVDKILEMLGMI